MTYDASCRLNEANKLLKVMFVYTLFASPTYHKVLISMV